MEPVSILSAAAAISAVAGKAWELGSFVRELYQGAKTVDGRVRRLESAVTELARACEHVQGQFESMSSTSSSGTPALVWDEQGALSASIDSQVKDCRRTLRELRRLLIDLRPSGSSFFGRTSRNIKLQDRGQQINDFSMRIKTHTDTLQMSLQIVIIRIALATPDFLLRQLGAALEDLRVRLSRIEKNSKPSTSQIDGGEVHETQFLEHVREALRSGTTLYDASTAGSIADAEFVSDIERAARIVEWNNNVGALHEIEKQEKNSSATEPDAVPTHVCAQKESGEKVVENSSKDFPSEKSADLLSEGQSVSGSDTKSVASVEATHTISLACDYEKPSISEPFDGNTSVEPDLVATDCADHANVDGNENTTPSPQFGPGGPNTETSLRQLGRKNSSSTRTDWSLYHESPVKTTNSEKDADHRDGLEQDTSTSSETLLKDTDKAENIPFEYPVDSSTPLDRTARKQLIDKWRIEITGRLEALICTGERIEPAVLSELAMADRAASAAQSSNTTDELQQERSGLALLLAAYFRDVYLIKPLIDLGFLPDAKLKLNDKDMPCRSPLKAAIGLRCEPVIQKLLDNGASRIHTCNEAPWTSLLKHFYLQLAPPTSVESIESVIDLLASASPWAPVVCVCGQRKDGSPYDWKWDVLVQALEMPADLSHYGMPLVTYLLEYLVSADNSSRYTADSPLCNAIHLDLFKTFDFLMEAADESTLKAWLRRKNSKGLSPLFEEITDAVANPTRSLRMVRGLLDKGASLDTLRWKHPDFIWTNKQTARQFALKSGRSDLIALVKEHDKKQKVRSV